MNAMPFVRLINVKECKFVACTCLIYVVERVCIRVTGNFCKAVQTV